MNRMWNPEIVTILVAISLLPATVLALACCVEWRRQKSRIRSVYAAQAAASLLHLADQVFFLLILVVPASSIEFSRGCVALTIIPPILFGMMQPTAVMVLLFRVTALLPSSTGLVTGTKEWILSKLPVRVCISLVFSVGWCFIVVSQVRGNWGVNMVTDRCVYVPDRSINYFGKVAYLVTYALIGITYVTALVRHGVWRFLVKKPILDSKHALSRPTVTAQAQRTKGGSSKLSTNTQVTERTGTDSVATQTGAKTGLTAVTTMGEDHYGAADRLNQALLSVMYRILLAVFTYFLTSSLALANFFAGGAYVQFTIENTCAILASTFATLSREQDWTSKTARMASEAAAAGALTEITGSKSVGHVEKQGQDGHVV